MWLGDGREALCSGRGLPERLLEAIRSWRRRTGGRDGGRRVGGDRAQPRSLLGRTLRGRTQGEAARPVLIDLDVARGARPRHGSSAREDVLPAGGGPGGAPEEEGVAELEAVGGEAEEIREVELQIQDRRPERRHL